MKHPRANPIMTVPDAITGLGEIESIASTARTGNPRNNSPVRSAALVLLLAVVVTACAPVSVLDRSLEFDSHGARIDELMAYSNQMDEFNGVVLVYRGSERVYARAFGFADHRTRDRIGLDTAFNMASTTKPVTATAILQLCELGELSLDTRVTDVIEGFPYPGVTVGQLLSHTSGVPDYSHHPSFIHLGHGHSEHTGEETEEDRGDILTNLDILRWIRTEKPPSDFSPGSDYKYSNTGYVVLASIVEETSGQDFASFVKKRILRPAGMHDSLIYSKVDNPLVPKRAYGFEPILDGTGYRLHDLTVMGGILGDGGLYATAENLHSFWDALQRGEILGREFFERATSPTILDSGKEVPYGYGWVVRQPTEQRPLTIKHGGRWRGFLTTFAMEPEHGYSIIILTNDSMYPQTMGDLETAISRILHGADYHKPRFPIGDVIARTFFEKGIEAAILRYEELRDKHHELYFFDEYQLIVFGYKLFEASRVDDAIALLELNSREYPDSSVVFSILGDFYLEAGRTERAIESFQNSLALNPDSQHAQRKLQDLQSGESG